MEEQRDVEEQNIGAKIKQLRKEKGYTIKMMAEYTGLSVGYLSTVEQDKTSLTINNLMNICEVLRVEPAWLLTSNTTKKLIVRKEEQRVVQIPELNQKMEMIEFGRKQKYEYITIEPGKPSHTDSFRHLYDEMGTVIEGVLTVDIEGEKHHLKKGDSIYIEANRPHAIMNEHEESCESFWVYQIQGI
ncbi:cupin domain-containing protein [Bariatricus massiliensis]|uniref:Cupin domain-containing protein n=1 Tax=Bariatricus massiliensis TaxID=1745713 RepID=A0ABS8DHV6_9FIRM|nr:cupin domain-containing protein [Bariatricus massiliensis]MCB7304958.1 cupin domain-containing protein [Bariatricus massiliensis]MCB7375512.1 cupin domain-containing protein [Bariatricus massiliensis]MCB7387972.1 cupin domain-containing protein [Bariatricus massiliensis]MCB7412208.1 cupin domain-containing protein [Bariatricus massiliensis]MCQ5253293.1 cupin domain-containing protein [Bariatricus massiliensis]